MNMFDKNCGKCDRILPSALFHKRSASNDGLAACCKECQKRYDRDRLHKPDRVESRMLYRNSPHGNAKTQEGQKRWIDKNDIKRKAHIAVGNALRSGILVRKSCEVCGLEKTHAHHDDYTKSLDVRWLCNNHHIEHHMRERDNANA